MKLSLLKIIAALSIVFATYSHAVNFADVKLTHIKPGKADAIWIRTKQVTPMYPIELAKRGIAGCGVFKITVDEDGETDEVELISSVPEKVIYKPARKVIKKWQWQNISDQPNRAEEKQIRLDFCIGGASEEEAKARCEAQAKMICGV